MEKVDARSLSPKAQERLRQLAVKAVVDGKKQVEVAKLFGVTRRAVSNWLRAYRNGGIPALKAKPKGRPYGLRGHTPVIVATGKRFGCNMISAITNQGQLNFMVFKGRFIAQVFLEFLSRLVRQSQRKVFLIVDRHPVHRSKKVKQWIEERPDEIQLFFLPGYSPELNPDELLNQDVKSNTIRKNRPSHQDELVKNVRSYLRKRQMQAHIVTKYFVTKYFQGKHVRYAAA